MSSIAIDLATATNVVVLALNLVLIGALFLITSQLQGISIQGLGTPYSKHKAKHQESSPLPVRSASDERMIEREDLRRAAERLEGEALVSKAVEDY